MSHSLFLLVALGALSANGCVRAGFEPTAGHDQGGELPDAPAAVDGDMSRVEASIPDGSSALEASIADGSSSADALSALFDDCSNPFLVDLQGLSASQTYTFFLDPALFTPNYKVCGGEREDFAVHVINAPAAVRVTCEGGDQIHLQTELGGAADCNAAVNGIYCASIPCNAGSGITFPTGGIETYVIFSRDASAGPITVHLGL